MERFRRALTFAVLSALVFAGSFLCAETFSKNHPAVAAVCSSQDDLNTQADIEGRLVDNGYDAYNKGDIRSAKGFWTEASHCSSRVPAWPKAVYNLGLTEFRQGNPRAAIAYFQRVLDSHPSDKEPGGDLMQAYRNYSYFSAFEISNCYQQLGEYGNALRYAMLAKYRYRYQSWCGTCIDIEKRRIDMRIASLTARRVLPYSIPVFLVGGVFLVHKKRNKKTATTT